MSRCRSNAVGQESFECFAWGEVAQDCAGAFVEFLGDGGQVGLGGRARGALVRFPPERGGIHNEDRDARDKEEVRPGVP